MTHLPHRIVARCYGGRLDGEWVTLEGSASGAFIVPATPMTPWDWGGADPQEEFKTITYRAMWIRPPGWRVAFPVFVVSGDSDSAARAIDTTYRTADCWPIEAGDRLRHLGDHHWPVTRNGEI